MKKQNKKYYILYKAITNEQGQTIDAENVNEFTTYEQIRDYLKCINRDIIKMVNNNNNINNLEDIKTYKNYFIIKE